MPIVTDPRDSHALAGDLVAPLAQPAAPPSPGLMNTLASASRTATLAGAGWERFINRGPDAEDVPGYDAFADPNELAGYEDHAPAFADSRSPAETKGIKARLDVARDDRETLRRAGLGGPAMEIAMNLVDPTFLASVAVPELAIAKVGRMGRVVQMAAEGAAAAGAYEAGMQVLQPDRTLMESAFNVGGGALLSGVLGGLIRRVPAAEREQLLRGATPERDTTPVRSEVGAASAMPTTTIEQESLARGGATVAKAFGLGGIAETDLARIMTSDSLEARRIVQELADVAPLLEKNFEGIATAPSVESKILRHEGAVADLSVELGRLYAQHRQNPRSIVVGAEALSREEFLEAVTVAARRGDTSGFPDVTEAARYLRSRVFDPLKAEAQKLGLLPKDVSVVGAQSYVTRLYSKDAIRANRANWDRILADHFERQGQDRAEAVATSEQVTRQILGLDAGEANFLAAMHVPSAGPLEERVLHIPDEVLEPFLINDPVEIGKRYVRALAPQIEVTKAFGDKDMADAVSKIRAEYEVRRERLRTGTSDPSRKLTQLADQEQKTLQALTRIRDRIYGRAGRLTPDSSTGERRTAEILRGWRNLVGAARLGGTALTGGVQDLSRIVAQYGFAPTVTRLAQLVTRPAFRQLSKANARRMGVATEVAMARRMAAATDGGATDGWTEKLASGVYRASGLNHVTDTWRLLAGTLIEDQILRSATDVAAGRKLPSLTRARLARIGLDEDALRGIAEQVGAHGQDADGIRVSNSNAWRDARLAERFETAIVRETRITVQQPGAADRVWFADGEVGKTLGQLKAFSLGAPLRMVAEPVQLLANGEAMAAARMVGFLMVGGYLSHAFRQLAAGKTPATDPAQASAEAFAESGLGAILPDAVSPLARRFGILGESAKFSDRNVASAYGGPAVGTMFDAYDVLMNRTQNGLSARDLQAIRRLLPGQNLWWLRRAINALEGEAAEAMDLKGADHATMVERVTRNEDLRPAAERGATGTGQIIR